MWDSLCPFLFCYIVFLFPLDKDAALRRLRNVSEEHLTFRDGFRWVTNFVFRYVLYVLTLRCQKHRTYVDGTIGTQQSGGRLMTKR